jgi:hypothetical protein
MGKSGKLRSVAIGVGVATALLVWMTPAFGSGRSTGASAARAKQPHLAITVSHGMVVRAWWGLRYYFTYPGTDPLGSTFHWGSYTFNAQIKHGHFAKQIYHGSSITELSGRFVGSTARVTLDDYFAVGPLDSNGAWEGSQTFTLRKVGGRWVSVQRHSPDSGRG